MQKNELNKNDLLKYNNKIIRILEINQDSIFYIDCIKKTMPTWNSKNNFISYIKIKEKELQETTNFLLPEMSTLDNNNKKITHERFTLISAILPFMSNKKQRCEMINKISDIKNISKQTIRHYLYLYLVYQDIAALAPKQIIKEDNLTYDEKNIRWALNKYFYTRHKNSLNTAYTLMLKERYCDDNGKLLSKYPSFYQFRYFYRKHRKLQNYYISRNGLKDYQSNNRPLLGSGVQEFAPNIGIGMLDSTVCDIYLVNESSELIGRPILTVCIDGYSSFCYGYSLTWEGGIYSLRGLMINILTNKVEHCKKFGIIIDESTWDSDKLPAIFVTDMGSEYKSTTFEQITELGTTIINLPPYRPELKGTVEKFFDLVQNSYKSHLKGKGVIESDFQKRGGHDYRKDACLTLYDFEKIIIRCIIYYNTQRIIKNFPYTDDMLNNNIKPYANEIFKWGLKQNAANLISVNIDTLILTLLPRTTGKFTRYGLKVNKMRYKHDNCTEMYLSNKNVTVSYNPEDVSYIWLIEKGEYIRFKLIDDRYKNKNINETEILQQSHKQLINDNLQDNIQAQIDLTNYIETIAAQHINKKVSIKNITQNRQNERLKTHTDYIKENKINE